MSLTSFQKSALAWGAVAVVLLLALWLLAPVLAPFVVAGVLAYGLSPLVGRLTALSRGRLPRVAAVLLVELLCISLLTGLVLLLVPILLHEWPQLRAQVPRLLEQLHANLQPLLHDWGIVLPLGLADLKPVVMKYLGANVEDALTSLLASLKIGGNVALTVLGYLILIPVALFFFLLDWDRLVPRLRTLVPPRLHCRADHFMAEVDAVLGQYLRGQSLVMLILALYYSVALGLFGLDLALPIGVFTGLAIFVPYVGFGVGLLLAVLAGLLEFTGPDGAARVALMVVVVYGLGQLLEGLYLTPRLLGERIGLHPLGVIFALLAFGQLFGFVGILVALPASAVLLVAARRLLRHYLDSRLYQG